MKNYLCKTAFVVCVSMMSTTPVFSQIITAGTPKVLIIDFLYEVYQTNQDALGIAKKYIALQNNPNDFSVDARYRGVAEHLTLLRKGQTVGQSTTEASRPIIFNPAKDKVVPYSEVNKLCLVFSLTKEQEDNTYVLIENGKPLRYFLVQGDKIGSFDYMIKGVNGPAYLLGY